MRVRGRGRAKARCRSVPRMKAWSRLSILEERKVEA